MRAGARELFWHVPLIARGAGASRVAADRLRHRRARRRAHRIDARRRSCSRGRRTSPRRTLFARDPGHARYTTSHNARKLLEARELLGAPLRAELARALAALPRSGRRSTRWLDAPPGGRGDRTPARSSRRCTRASPTPTTIRRPPIVLDRLGTRAFEEQIWTSIAGLAEGEFRQKSNADGIKVNRGKHGGPAATAAHLHVHERRDLDALGDHLHARYRALIAAHGMTGRAEVVDHVFRWETDFAFPWMDGWATNQSGRAARAQHRLRDPGQRIAARP